MTSRLLNLFTGAIGSWSISRARSAIDAHEEGDFSESAMLAKSSKRFYRIAGALNTRTGALKARAGLPFQVERSDRGDQRKTQTVADRMRDLWWDVCPETVIAQHHEDAVQLHRSVGYLEWTVVKVGTRREKIPLLHHLPASGLHYRDFERAWYYTTADGPERVTPGDGFWFLHEAAETRPPFGGTILPLGMMYPLSTLTERGWARWCEKHGLATLAVKEPAFAADDVEAKAAFYEQFRKLGSEPVLREPQSSAGEGWEARWLEAMGGGWQSFRGFLEYVGDASEYTVTGMTPRGDQPVGGDGESVRERVRVEHLAGDAEPMSTSLRDQVWKPWGRENYDGWEDDTAGWGRWDTRPPADLVVRADILAKAADLIPRLGALGADTEALLDEFRVPRPKKTEQKQPMPQADPAAAAAAAAAVPAAPVAEEVKPIPVTPTDLALAVTIDEVRTSNKLDPEAGANGGELVAERRARLATVIAQGAAAEQGKKPGEGDAPPDEESEDEEEAATT